MWESRENRRGNAAGNWESDRVLLGIGGSPCPRVPRLDSWEPRAYRRGDGTAGHVGRRLGPHLSDDFHMGGLPMGREQAPSAGASRPRSWRPRATVTFLTLCVRRRRRTPGTYDDLTVFTMRR
jgi:hypothetical protein